MADVMNEPMKVMMLARNNNRRLPDRCNEPKKSAAELSKWVAGKAI
jgi:hypothetical protein